MNKAFLAFNDKAIGSGIGSWEPQLAQDLKFTMESFIEYARYMEQESDDEDEKTAPNLSARVFEEQSANSAKQPQPALVPSGPAESQDLTAEDATVAALLGYTPISQVSKETSIQRSQVETEQAVETTNHDISDWPAPEPLHQYRMEVPSRDVGLELFPPAFPKSPPLPSSYSFQETSFARRLLRTALEGAYRLLTNPNTRSEDLIHFCRDTFTWTNRKHCIQWLEQALSRTARESLEYWGAPQLHIGGAGLHYARTGFDTGLSPPPGWADQAPMGPLPFMTPENLLDGNTEPADITDAVGFGGEWFDSNDVEQYLQTKGLFLDGRSSYVELDVDVAVEQAPELNMPMMGSPTDSSGDSNGYSPSPRTHDSILLDGPIFEENVSLWNDEISAMANFDELDAGSLFDSSILSKAKDASHAGFFASVAQPLRMSSYGKMSKRYIDVEKFIISSSPSPYLALPTPLTRWVAVMQSAVCLGRTPGFRRSAVDAALEAAIHVRF